jgi:hypothetical protein
MSLFFPFSAKTQFSLNLPPSHPISRQAISKFGNAETHNVAFSKLYALSEVAHLFD